LKYNPDRGGTIQLAGAAIKYDWSARLSGTIIRCGHQERLPDAITRHDEFSTCM